MNTRRSYGEQLHEMHTGIVALGSQVADTVGSATRTLLDRDLDGARRIIDGDDVIDAATIALEEQCSHILVLQSPMAGDLRAVISALRLAPELERCGDLAVNIAKTARRCYDVEIPPKLRGMIDRMSVLAVHQLRFAMEAYAESDEAKAAALDDQDDELDELHRAFVEAVFEFQLSQLVTPRFGVQLALLGRFYERLGDHAVNVGERVRYQVSGWTPEHRGTTHHLLAQAAAADTEPEYAEPVIDRGVVLAGDAERRRVEALRRDFVANIGHELRTPVGALAVLAETLHTEVDQLPEAEGTPTVQRLSQRLTHEATRLGHTIDDLLELSRLETGEPLVAADQSVTGLIDAAVERTRPAAALAEVYLQADGPDAEVTVPGDRRQLISALTNLIDNAIKYSEADGTVEVRADLESDWAHFVVRDHGIGIPHADQVRIFERFHRVDRARRRDTGGTGLGLSIVRHVALNHAGTIEVESTEGDGATFTLSIPRHPDERRSGDTDDLG